MSDDAAGGEIRGPDPDAEASTTESPRRAGSELADTADYGWLTADAMLHEPILLVALSGWIDASGAAAAAADAVADECAATPLLRFDDDTFVDFRARRPTMELRDGVNTNLIWNSIELSSGRSPNGHDIVILSGPEPDMAWHRFARCVQDIAGTLGVTQMIGFGAYPFATPHTRSPRLSCSSPSTDVLGQVTFARSSVDVPAGMAAVLEHAMHARKIPALGIWAQVPHYVSSMSYPAASVALLDGLAEATGVEITASDLRHEIGIQRARIDRMVEGNAEHVEMIHQLEALHDAALDDDAEQIADELRMKSGDELAAEIQEFLRKRD